MTQLDDEAGKFIEELKREEWDGRRPRSLLRRVRELVDDTTLVKGKGPYTTHENDIVDRTVLSYRKVISQITILTRHNP